jgi:hypothetical protein
MGPDSHSTLKHAAAAAAADAAVAGGSVPVVYKFKTDQGNATAAVAQLLQGKSAKKNPVDAVFIATTDLDFVAGMCNSF